MTVFALIPENHARHLAAQLIGGFETYNVRHKLGWTIHRLQKNDRWRIGDYLQRHPGERCAVMGLLHYKAVNELKPWRERMTLLSATDACPDPEAWVTHVDDTSIGRQAVDHLHQSGYRHLATWGHWGVHPRKARFTAVEERCRELNIPTSRLIIPHHIGGRKPGDAFLLEQLAELPKPLGIITHEDGDAVFLQTFCISNGIRVPQDIGLLGVDDNVLLCTQNKPTLSSVRVPWNHLGDQLAQVWHRISSGGDIPVQRRMVPAYGVHARTSTDLLRHLVDDKLVRQFLNTARRIAIKGAGVRDVLTELGVSQPTLYRRVRASLNRRPQEIILDLRITKACDLLRNTDLPITAVAHKSGFASQQSLHQAFTARYPVSPGQWRKG